jgi:AraC family cel operon transcriptional repressor
MFKLFHQEWPSSHACTYVVWNYDRTVVSGTHDQDYYELFWVESGRGVHTINGEQRLMESGYLVMIRPDDVHGFSSLQNGEPVRFINFAVRPAIWEQICSTFFPGKHSFFDGKSIKEREFHIGGDDRERLRIMAADLAAGRWTKTNAAAFLHGVLALLANRQPGNSSHPALPEWLAYATRSIETWPHFTEGVPKFVRLAGRSHEHVSRDCRKHLNTTPRELVNRSRLKWAAMQLETTDKKIIDIATECGFENLGHFYKLFRQTHHLTPRSYRLKFGIRERE